MVYGSPSVHLRRYLWSSLNRDNTIINDPWLIACDFNAVTNTEEISNPDSVGNHRNSDFKNWTFDETLIDLGFKGQKFAWKMDEKVKPSKVLDSTERYVFQIGCLISLLEVLPTSQCLSRTIVLFLWKSIDCNPIRSGHSNSKRA